MKNNKFVINVIILAEHALVQILMNVLLVKQKIHIEKMNQRAKHFNLANVKKAIMIPIN